MTWGLGSSFFRLPLADVTFETAKESEGEERKLPVEEIVAVIERPRHIPEGVIALRGASVITMRGEEVIPGRRDRHHRQPDHGHRAKGIGSCPRRRAANRRRWDDDHAGDRGRSRSLVRNPARRARHAEPELSRHPGPWHHDWPRSADHHQRHVRLSGSRGHGRDDRAEGLFNRASDLPEHQLSIRRGCPECGREVQEVLPDEDVEVLLGRQPETAAVDGGGLQGAPDHGPPRKAAATSSWTSPT